MLKVQKGIVKYKDRSDIVCTYGTLEDNTNYYFLDFGGDYKLSNGNYIASTELVEAIDPMYTASHVGVIDEDGNVVIPFNHRAIRSVTDDILLVELAEPVSDCVKEAVEKRESSMATSLVSTSALIKDRLNEKMDGNGKFLFNDQFSEATLCDVNGNNLLDGEYYSYITQVGDQYYLSKNDADSKVVGYPPIEEKEEVEEAAPIDVSKVEVPTEVVEEALENVPEESTVEEVSQEKVVEEVPETVEEVPQEEPVEEAPIEEEVQPEEEEVALNIGPVEEENDDQELVKLNFEEEENTTPEEVIIEEDEEKEDTPLDELIQTNDNFDEGDDPLKDYMIETDDIELPEEFNESVEVDDMEASDSIVEDVAKYMQSLMSQNKSLMEQNKKLIVQNNKLKESLEKMIASRNAFISKLNSQEKKIDTLTNKIKSLESDVSRLEQKNQEQGKIIDSQAQDRVKLEKVLEEVQQVLGEN